MRLFTFIALVLFTTAGGWAQEGRVRLGDSPPSAGVAQLHITPMPGQIPSSLKELSDSSLLIVEATVKAVLPSRETGPRALETDAVLTIKRALKGPSNLREVVVSQRGGSRGNLVVMPVQYALMTPGESYLLFLTNDNRPNIPEVAGFSRYLITGIWSGLFRFQEGRVRTSARKVDRLRSKYEGVTAEELLREVENVLR